MQASDTSIHPPQTPFSTGQRMAWTRFHNIFIHIHSAIRHTGTLKALKFGPNLTDNKWILFFSFQFLEKWLARSLGYRQQFLEFQLGEKKTELNKYKNLILVKCFLRLWLDQTTSGPVLFYQFEWLTLKDSEQQNLERRDHQGGKKKRNHSQDIEAITFC